MKSERSILSEQIFQESKAKAEQIMEIYLRAFQRMITEKMPFKILRASIFLGAKQKKASEFKGSAKERQP